MRRAYEPLRDERKVVMCSVLEQLGPSIQERAQICPVCICLGKKEHIKWEGAGHQAGLYSLDELDCSMIWAVQWEENSQPVFGGTKWLPCTNTTTLVKKGAFKSAILASQPCNAASCAQVGHRSFRARLSSERCPSNALSGRP